MYISFLRNCCFLRLKLFFTWTRRGNSTQTPLMLIQAEIPKKRAKISRNKCRSPIFKSLKIMIFLFSNFCFEFFRCMHCYVKAWSFFSKTTFIKVEISPGITGLDVSLVQWEKQNVIVIVLRLINKPYFITQYFDSRSADVTIRT